MKVPKFALIAIGIFISTAGFSLQLKAIDMSNQKVLETVNFENVSFPEDELSMIASCRSLLKSSFKKTAIRVYFTVEYKNMMVSIFPNEVDADKFDFNLVKDFFEYWSEYRGDQDGIKFRIDTYRDDRGRVTKIDSFEKDELKKSVQFIYENNIVARVLESNMGYEYDSTYDDSGRLIKKLVFEGEVVQDQSFFDFVDGQTKLVYDLSSSKKILTVSTIQGENLVGLDTYQVPETLATKLFEIEDLRVLPDSAKGLEKKSFTYDDKKRLLSEVTSNAGGLLSLEYQYGEQETTVKKLRNNEVVEVVTSRGSDDEVFYYSKGRPVLKRVFINGVLKSEERLK